MKMFSKYVGLDVRKDTIAVSVAEADGGEVRYHGESPICQQRLKSWFGN